MALLREYHVSGENWYTNLKAAAANPDFVARRNAIWDAILENEGGKLTFGTALAIVGALLGGAGIAMMGGAFGLPLVCLLAPLGVWIGNEADEEQLTRRFLAKFRTWSRSGGGALAKPPRGL
ncbi:MAG: hypothetical protein ACRD0Y_04020 [Terriglobales bacterium]